MTNLTKSEIEKSARKYAQKLLAEAIKNEPEITKDLQEIASQISVKLIGMESKFKTEKSLSQKLAKNSLKNIKRLLEEHFSIEYAIETSLNFRAEEFNDVLRFTVILSDENYVFGYKRFLSLLKQKNYKIPKSRIWNAWKNVGTIFDKGYRGINITVISSKEQKFELQFHTTESFELKNQTHKLYKESNKANASQKRRIEIQKTLLAMAQEIKVPKGIEKI